MKVFEYNAVIWKESEGYVSKCSEIGVASCGDSFEHAVSNLREAVELYLENAKELDLIEQDLRLRSLALTRLKTFQPDHRNIKRKERCHR